MSHSACFALPALLPFRRTVVHNKTAVEQEETHQHRIHTLYIHFICIHYSTHYAAASNNNKDGVSRQRVSAPPSIQPPHYTQPPRRPHRTERTIAKPSIAHTNCKFACADTAIRNNRRHNDDPPPRHNIANAALTATQQSDSSTAHTLTHYTPHCTLRSDTTHYVLMT